MKPIADQRPLFCAVFCVATLLLGGCQQRPKTNMKTATTATFTNGMVAYLKARGDLCLSKQFPIDVSDRELELRSRNALQMPALEHAGLVVSTETMGETKTEDGSVPTKVRRYHLTEAGMHYYLSRPVPGEMNGNGQQAVRSDLCAVKLSLNKVVSFELSPPAAPTNAVVTYTYEVDPAPWLSSPEIQRVFPAVANVVRSAGSAQLKEGFTLTSEGWMANELVSQSAQPVANR
jgi:hypothetical protein